MENILQGRNLCPHCFTKLDEAGACPQCGAAEHVHKYPKALAEGVVLADRYVVGSVLGKGGFGITYLCYDLRREERVAVKEYFPDLLSHRNTGETRVSTQTSARSAETSGVVTNVARGSMRTGPPSQRKTSR